MNSDVNSSDLTDDGTHTTPRRGLSPAPVNSRPSWKPYQHDQRQQQQLPQFWSNYRRDQPLAKNNGGRDPRVQQKSRPSFVIELQAEFSTSHRREDIAVLIDKCKSKPDDFTVFQSGMIAAKLCFLRWSDALEAFVCLWELRFDEAHNFTPNLISNVLVPSDFEQVRTRLKAVFHYHIEGYLMGDVVQKWARKLDNVLKEIDEVSIALKRYNKLHTYEELKAKKEGLVAESDLIMARTKEFKWAMSCLLDRLEGKNVQERHDNSVVLQVLRFALDYNWSMMYQLIRREFRRLENGLPIYAFRHGILNHIHSQQIMVLIGETGSGKSTQLVQYLLDSGLADNGSIICTQPRKIAAMSLVDRVKEEIHGCYEDNSITFASTCTQRLDSKVIFMTDHCLLQHYMNNKTLHGISCIVVDEAHERSLNTDLLLALLKNLLRKRVDLRLIIMSATANAEQLSDYFFSCGTFNVIGRNFPVDIRYVSSLGDGSSGCFTYAADVLKLATEILKMEIEGTILAFLTSQVEVEWACEQFNDPSAIALPLHGKLSHQDQFRIFQNFPGKRKVIFTTNLAETSLTIPGVKYVIDSGMVKESKFEPGTGMNVLKVCRISKSAADQRAGRAGRTEPGRCYRLYSKSDYQSMSPHQEPEIRRVHLGIAVLRILALGIKDVQTFDFVDAPSAKAIDMAIRNLIQLGAVKSNNGDISLTCDGRYFVKLGIEPRLGKLILSCFHHRLCREGIVLAAVMSNASSIFCRVGNEEDKLKSDRLKVQFSHHSGDLFTLLSVYKEWELLPLDKRNNWCWEKSINAKSMRRCEDTVHELESCLKNELLLIIPSYWLWNPHLTSEHDVNLKNAILSSLSENVAMYSGYDRLGYEVALTGQHLQLHPSCSLLNFGEKPGWVVFGELLSVSNQYLVCVTSFDFPSLATLSPPPLFDISMMEMRKLQVRVIIGRSSTLLKRFCGKSNSGLNSLKSRMRTICMDERIGIEINVVQNEILVFASSQDVEKVLELVNDALDCEKIRLQNECMEKCVYHGGRVSPPVALFGAGAEIRHLELEGRCLSVDVYHSDLNANEDKELLTFLEKSASANICTVQRVTSTHQDSEIPERGARVTFFTPDDAMMAAALNKVLFNGSLLKVNPSRTAFGGDSKMFSFPEVRAKIKWHRRYSKGIGIIKCRVDHVPLIADELFNFQIRGNTIRCEPGRKYEDSVVVNGIDKELSEADVLDALGTATDKILDFFLLRGKAVENPPCHASEEAIYREISPFLPKRNPCSNCCRVQVLPNGPDDTFTSALITFDGRMHLEAAKALEGLEGKVLAGCFPWQKIKCQQWFQSSVYYPASIYLVIESQLKSLLASFRHMKGAECSLERNENGSRRVKISANATRTVAQLRRPLEQLMRGKNIEHASLNSTILQHLFTRDGIMFMISLQKQTGTYILFDRQSLTVRIFGSSEKISEAEQRLVHSLLSIHESKRLEIHLRGANLPTDLMKEVVKKFGPELHGLKIKVPDAELTLNTRRHVISLIGNTEMKNKIEELVYDVARTGNCSNGSDENEEDTCAICLCEVEDGYVLEACSHEFCRSCLVEQCESAIKSQDSFPMKCTHKGCTALILLTDLKHLLSNEKLEELFRASLGAYVALSKGNYRFCPTPDCPSIYSSSDPSTAGEPFVCGACYVETCTRCHLEYHQYISCEKYQEFKDDPDSSLKEWCEGKVHVKTCPMCGYTIEKVDGCNHMACKCGGHICWVCLEYFRSSDDCTDHLNSVHLDII